MEDPDPPTPVAFHVLDNEGNQTNVIRKNDPATLLFTVSDEEYLDNFRPGGLPVVFDSVEVYTKKHSDSEWIALEVDSVGYDSRDGLTCQSIVNGTGYDTTHFDVKIASVDEAGNRTDSIISPAFFIKNIQVPTAVDDSYTLEAGHNFKPEDPVTINDIDPFGELENLKAELVSDVSHGQLQYFRSLGTFLYRASVGYTGVDAFTYRVRNEKYASNIATVTLNITPEAIPEISKQATNNQFWIYPNPAHEIINIGFRLEEAGEIRIEAYDITGTKLATIFDGLLDGGEHTLIWDLADREPFSLLPGMYYVAFRSESVNEIQKVVIR